MLSEKGIGNTQFVRQVIEKKTVLEEMSEIQRAETFTWKSLVVEF